MSKLAVLVCLALCMVVAVQSKCDSVMVFEKCVEDTLTFFMKQTVLSNVQCKKIIEAVKCVKTKVPSCDISGFKGLKTKHGAKCGITYSGCNLSDFYKSCATEVFNFIMSFKKKTTQNQRCKNVKTAMKCAKTHVPSCVDVAVKFSQTAYIVKCE